mgnify:CR=1 FL=1
MVRAKLAAEVSPRQCAGRPARDPSVADGAHAGCGMAGSNCSRGEASSITTSRTEADVALSSALRPEPQRRAVASLVEATTPLY